MKKHLLTVLLCAYAISFAPFAAAASETVSVETVKEELPFFKKKKGSKARYIQLKRNNGTYVKKRTSNKKKSFLGSSR
ncbi:hypothetical protein ACD591_13785 [Rufibacter glacialis]|uniref:Uncharacterized protein n=1 Tax=Rufibacter glacialis TaxID=1259555 RepID=A0A5M8Q7I4_9BACT|nr:hypothetical protein [Rufibacter glacialis]KAA6431078.1 hypothetical protein FOE74_18440 [Rufibacter glacialis]GGK83803.1 hypothetical protein GCM10011405_34670 [Rufibacter glacialis]